MGNSNTTYSTPKSAFPGCYNVPKGLFDDKTNLTNVNVNVNDVNKQENVQNEDFAESTIKPEDIKEKPSIPTLKKVDTNPVLLSTQQSQPVSQPEIGNKIDDSQTQTDQFREKPDKEELKNATALLDEANAKAKKNI